MRVIAGSLGGRGFNSPGTHRTHPMSDKMRGALFNILGDISGLEILDAFGGSGALSFEGVSRGAATALVLESDKTAQQTIASNIRSLGLGRKVRLVQAAAGPWLQTNTGAQFDIVLCDPPYDDLQPNLLHKLAAAVRPGGLLVVSYPAAEAALGFAGLELIKQQNYGDGQLIFYRA